MGSKEQILNGLKVLEAIRDTIYEAGANGAPLGPMYMACNQSGMELATFQQAIALLEQAGCITVSNHCAYRKVPQ